MNDRIRMIVGVLLILPSAVLSLMLLSSYFSFGRTPGEASLLDVFAVLFVAAPVLQLCGILLFAHKKIGPLAHSLLSVVFPVSLWTAAYIHYVLR